MEERNLLLWRFLERDLTGEEQEEVMDWLRADPQNHLDFEKLKEVFLISRAMAVADKADKDVEWAELKSKISSESRVRSLFVTLRRIAAVLLIGMCCVLSFWILRKEQRKYAGFLNWTTISVPADSVKKIRLPDGGAVWINSGSSVRFSKELYGRRREVYLRGEAYFEVASDRSRPFVVYSKGIKTRVLGTSFVIKAYEAGRVASITVSSGKIAVETPQMTRVLGRDEQLTFNKRLSVIQHRNVNAAEYAAWINGAFQFNQTAFSEIAKELKKRYGVLVSFSDNRITNYRITASFKKDATLQHVLRSICLVHRLKYKIEGKYVTVSN